LPSTTLSNLLPREEVPLRPVPRNPAGSVVYCGGFHDRLGAFRPSGCG